MTYKSLSVEILGAGVEVRALTAEGTLKVKNLEEVIKTEELLTAGGHRGLSATEGVDRDSGSLGSATCDERKQVR